VRLSDDERLLSICMHHLICDGWSSGVFASELTTTYLDLLRGNKSTLAPLPIQYSDFAAWQREQLAGPAMERLLEAWRGALEGSPDLTTLPGDRPRPPRQSDAGATTTFVIPRAILHSLRSLARRENATLYMMLLAGFVSVLHRYTGQSDLCVGTPVAN